MGFDSTVFDHDPRHHDAFDNGYLLLERYTTGVVLSHDLPFELDAMAVMTSGHQLSSKESPDPVNSDPTNLSSSRGAFQWLVEKKSLFVPRAMRQSYSLNTGVAGTQQFTGDTAMRSTWRELRATAAAGGLPSGN